jgi:hypothetical protein
MQIAEKSLPAFTESLQVAYSHLSCLQVWCDDNIKSLDIILF